MSISMTWPQYRRHEVTFYGVRITLKRMEAELLSVLLANRGTAIRVQELIEMVYPNPDVEPEYAVNCIHHLAMKLRRTLPGVVQSRGHWGYCVERAA
jgi:DNA-binding response OmpR family regulator